MITRRAVRIGIFDKEKNNFFFNISMVQAEQIKDAADKWSFKNTPQNPVIFRTT